MSFDFSTLYTKISQNKFEKVMYELSDFCFEREGNLSISFNKKVFKKLSDIYKETVFLIWYKNIPSDYRNSYGIRPCTIYC